MNGNIAIFMEIYIYGNIGREWEGDRECEVGD